jgi:predicted transcriptional regulator
MNSPAYKTISTQVPVDMVADLDELAKRLERPRQWVVRKAIDAYVQRELEKEQLTREAMASVRAGQIVSSDAVTAWIDSWDTDNELPRPEPAR